jgi:hypothetical protein
LKENQQTRRDQRRAVAQQAFDRQGRLQNKTAVEQVEKLPGYQHIDRHGARRQQRSAVVQRVEKKPDGKTGHNHGTKPMRHNR